MKKTVSIILVLVMVLTICGCGKKVEHPTNSQINSGQNEPLQSEEIFDESVPTEEENEALLKYNGIVYGLNHYEDGNISVEAYDEEGYFVILEGQEAMRYCVEWLPKLECVDKWVGTPFCLNGWDDPNINWNREELMNSISIIEDVLVEEIQNVTDAVGNHKIHDRISFDYNTTGNLISVDSKSGGLILPYLGWSIENAYGHDLLYTYDENGGLKELKFLSVKSHETLYLVTPTYDSTGKKVSDTVVYQDGTKTHYSYTYESDRVVTISKDMDDRYNHSIWYYTYDEQGNLIAGEEINQYDYTQSAFEYTYSPDGTYITGTSTTNGGETYEITRNNQGRILTWTTNRSGWILEYEFVYGDYYVFSK